ncbi:uncharacterized protein MONBRDRAFT_37937 [Monosiga brevicollis MX1]|uniref:Amino acid transporter transmembrane domain-containing protein n=1 Tax=Monosiga brevicollis TaxID=81824 RepID=A9V4P5_MONBE|nr:uncharacterized protein MONBRDRAFT_37937 [Monosiga brevicollis MX1]EDQ87491.1 predicted protein [Monosiga brevicollis MX1]|eukprot:XP_001747751.1 hypothetical protein [Monosiga brevicollis MX1]
MLCESMQRIPGNFTFEHRYEFATTVRHYYGRTAYIIFQVFYNLSMQASNIAAMIISARVLDKFIGKIAGHSYALDYVHWGFVKSTDDADHPWCAGDLTSEGCEDLTFVISVGFLICMAICIPFGYLNLDENMWFQWVSLAGLLLFTCEFFVQFILKLDGEDKLCLDNVDYGNVTCNYHPSERHIGNFSHNGPHRTPIFQASAEGQANVVGMAIFAYSYVVTIPSWVNEKRHHVSVNKSVWVPASVGLVMKLLTGLLGGWAFALLLPDGSPRPHSDDILNIILHRDQPEVSQYSAYLWDITTLIPGIPVLAIMVRYNLLSGKVCNRFWSFVFGVVAPWVITAFCYETNVLQEFCNWVAIVVQGYINFVIPAMLYRSALYRYPDHNAEQFSGTMDYGSSEAFRFPPDQKAVNYGSVQTPVEYRVMSADPEGEETALLGKTIVDESGPDTPGSFVELDEAPVEAVPRFLTFCGKVFKINRIYVANFMIIFFSLLSTASIVINIFDIFQPNS